VLALTALMTRGSLADGPSLLRDGSFEDARFQEHGWAAYAYGGATLARDTNIARTGAASVRMDLPAGAAGEYPAYKYRLDGVKPGARYDGVVWARTENATGLGGYVVIEFYAADAHRISFAQGNYTRNGTTDWRPLRVSGFVPDEATSLALGFVAHGTGTVWFDDAELRLAQPAPPEFTGSSVSLKVLSDRILCERFMGFGAQGDFFLTLPANTNHGVGEADVQRVLGRVAEMRPHLIRTFFSYAWWEPQEGRQTPGSPEMRDYVRWVRFLKGIGTEVLLTPWGDCFAYSAWMEAGQSRLPAPGKREAMVRSLVDLIAHLRREEGLKNVHYVALMNEPANDWLREPPPAEFVRLNRMLDRVLRERGLRSDVQLLGIDDCCGSPTVATEWYRDVVQAGVDYCDAISVHTYDHQYVPALRPWLEDRFRLLRAASPRRSLPIVVTEFGYGGDTYKNHENGKYEYGLFLADFATTALREGAAGALMWCLMDTYYGDKKQEYGLWRHGEEGWKPRPGYYAWSLITRYTQLRSRVLEMSVDPAAFHVRAVALRAPNGALTCLVVNRYPRNLDARLQLGKSTAKCAAFTYARDAVAAAGDGMLTSKLLTSDRTGSVELTLPAEAFVLVCTPPGGPVEPAWKAHP
jgi:hypothetical protein